MRRSVLVIVAGVALAVLLGGAPRAGSEPPPDLALLGVTQIGDRTEAWLIDRRTRERETGVVGGQAFGFRIVAIRPESVVLSRNGARRELRLGEKPLPAPAPPTAVKAPSNATKTVAPPPDRSTSSGGPAAAAARIALSAPAFSQTGPVGDPDAESNAGYADPTYWDFPPDYGYPADAYAPPGYPYLAPAAPYGYGGAAYGAPPYGLPAGAYPYYPPNGSVTETTPYAVPMVTGVIRLGLRPRWNSPYPGAPAWSRDYVPWTASRFNLQTERRRAAIFGGRPASPAPPPYRNRTTVPAGSE